MSWIKRNLYFVIGGVTALVLMGLAGFYLFTKWELNNKMLSDLQEQYDQLDHLNKEPVHPGSGSVDNIQAAKDQQKQLRDYLKQTRKYFERISPIPDMPKLSGQDFSAGLRRTIDQLRHSAQNASVNLSQQDYAFSFGAETKTFAFDEKTLPPLAVQLGEVKVICDVLFDAKVNSIDNIRREKSSPDDASGQSTDYLIERSVTNELAVMTPYELTFRCFSSELASLLAGFAASPYGLLVKTINVELAPSTETLAATTPPPGGYAAPPPYVPPPQSVTPGAGPPPGVMERFGRPMPTPAPAPGPAPAPVSRGGLPTVLDERQLKITMLLDVVKLLPAK